jgi:lipocalin
MMRNILFAFGIILGVGARVGYSQTVPSVNITAYLGDWIQVYYDYAVKDTFEYDVVCDVAQYSLNGNGTIRVINSGNRDNTSGPLDIVYGWAEQNNPKEPGQLLVHLQPTGGIGAPYWIYQLGPIVNGSYQYSIVSDDLKFTLFVLARNRTDFLTHYNEEVLAWLFKNGFNGIINKPIVTNQTDCVYPWKTTRKYF